MGSNKEKLCKFLMLVKHHNNMNIASNFKSYTAHNIGVTNSGSVSTDAANSLQCTEAYFNSCCNIHVQEG